MDNFLAGDSGEIAENKPVKKVSKFTKFEEWGRGKDIEPIGINKIDEPNEAYADAEGKTWRFEYFDHDNQGMKRSQDTKYDGLFKAIKFNKVERGKKYHVTYGQLPGRDIKGWTFTKI